MTFQTTRTPSQSSSCCGNSLSRCKPSVSKRCMIWERNWPGGSRVGRYDLIHEKKRSLEVRCLPIQGKIAQMEASSAQLLRDNLSLQNRLTSVQQLQQQQHEATSSSAKSPQKVTFAPDHQILHELATTVQKLELDNQTLTRFCHFVDFKINCSLNLSCCGFA